jgi:hypothetical protein
MIIVYQIVSKQFLILEVRIILMMKLKLLIAVEFFGLKSKPSNIISNNKLKI